MVTTDFIADGLNVCETNYNAASYFTLSLKIRKTVISAILGIVNFVICYKVVTQIKRNLNSPKNVSRTLIICFVFEVIIVFRNVLLWR